ncbi:MAG TPA: amino acid ABC transporter ATP-binding protein [Luteitalea sp.]|nr:amino acid ABC transporter ATP-binding protein [Luteitalea sp.]
MIQVSNVVKRYGATTVLDRATFAIAEGQLTTILGPSGCGKSTMLRCLNRLEPFDEGRITIGDLDVQGGATADEGDLVQRVRSRVGIVFQQFHLFPHLSVLDNVAEAPRTVKRLSRPEAVAIARHYLDRVGMSGRDTDYPAQLSGGQQQRVAIARALAMEPDVVLFDEPTSALDPRLVRDVATLFRRLDDLKKTLVVVSHDMDFARDISDQVIFFEGGRAVETGTAQTIFGQAQQAATRAFLETYHGPAAALWQ